MNLGTLWAHIGLDYSLLDKGVVNSKRQMQALETQSHNMAKGLSVATLGYASLATVAASSMYGMVQAVKYGIQAVDSYQMSVAKTASMLASLKVNGDIAENYKQAKVYAEGLQDVLMNIDARTSLNLDNLQSINEELIKQGVQFDYNNKSQIEGFTNLANAVAMYSNAGRDERQLRQEIRALVMGEVNDQAQLSSMMQRTVKGPMSDMVMQWKATDQFLQEAGGALKGFGEGAKDIEKTWSAASSSFQTSLTLLARAVFAEPFQDLVDVLGRVNVYLREHREEIANRILPVYRDFKAIVSGIGTVIGAIARDFDALYAAAKWSAMAAGAYAAASAVGALSIAWTGLQVAITASLASNPIGWLIALGGTAVYAGYKIAETISNFRIKTSKELQMLSSHKIGGIVEGFKIDRTKKPEEWEKEKSQLQAQLGARKAMNDQALVLAKSRNQSERMLLESRWEAEEEYAKKVRDEAERMLLESHLIGVKEENAIRTQNQVRKMLLESRWVGEEERAKLHFRQLENLELAEIDKQIANAKNTQGIMSQIANTISQTGGPKSPEYIKIQGEMAKSNSEIQTLLQERINVQLKYKQEYDKYVLDLAATRRKEVLGFTESYTKLNVELEQLLGTDLESKLSQIREQYREGLDKAFIFKGLARGPKEQALADNLIATYTKLIQQQTELASESSANTFKSVTATYLETLGKMQEAARMRVEIMESGEEYKKLVAAAMKGEPGAEKAFWSTEALNQLNIAKGQLADLSTAAAIASSTFANSLAKIDQAESQYFITASDAVKARIALLQQEMQAENQHLANIVGNTAEEIQTRLQLQANVLAINDKLIAQQKILNDRFAFQGMISGLKDYANEAERVGAHLHDVVTRAFDGMTEALVKFVKSGKLSFKDLANSIISDMIRIQIQQSITGPLASGLASLVRLGVGMVQTGLSPSQIEMANSPPERAEGGPVSFGTSYLVGERGPELFTPRVNGMITPNSALSGGGNNLSISVPITMEGSKRMAAELRNEIEAVVINVIRRHS